MAFFKVAIALAWRFTACLVNCFKVAEVEQGLPRGRLSIRIVPKEVSDIALNARLQVAVRFPLLELLERQKHQEICSFGSLRPF